MALEKVYRPCIHNKHVGVIVSHITPAMTKQPDLFEINTGLSTNQRTISEAIDDINQKLVADTVVLASQLYT